jgi:TrmH family RNA methyltransferase
MRWGARVEELLAVPGAGGLADLRSCAVTAGSRVIEVSERVIRAVADVETPQPVAAVIALPEPVSLIDIRWYWLVVADGLQDPGNIGALIRTAHAAGFDALGVTDGTADPFNPKAIRASAGSCFALPIIQVSPDVIRQGARVWVADANGEHDYRRVRFEPPVALIFGSEGRGPAHAWPGAHRVRIPIRAGVESLNVTAAAAILLFAARHGQA